MRSILCAGVGCEVVHCIEMVASDDSRKLIFAEERTTRIVSMRGQSLLIYYFASRLPPSCVPAVLLLSPVPH